MIDVERLARLPAAPNGGAGAGVSMGSADDRFRRACGAVGSLHLAWEGATPGETVERRFESPAVIVGSAADCDVVIDHPDVSARHVYLQVVNGCLFAIDLESRTGLQWDGVPRRSGWVDPDQPVTVGPTTLRILDGVEPGLGPGPATKRYASRHKLPGVVLEFGESPGQVRRYAMERVFVLAGSAPSCQIRLIDASTPPCVAALLRTPTGVWVVDLLSSQSVSVNGARCRYARLVDGDWVALGNWSAHIRYEDAAPAAMLPMPVTSQFAATLAEVPDDDLFSTSLVGALLDRAAPPEASTGSPFGQALLLLIRLLGDIHRDHLELVRSELQRIDTLSRDIAALKSRLETSMSLPVPEQSAVAEAPAAGPFEQPFAPPGYQMVAGQPGPVEPLPPPDPVVIHEVINERIKEWERERQSRWRKVLRHLVRS